MTIVDGQQVMRHYLLVRPSLHAPVPKVLGSYGCWADAKDARSKLGGTLLEIDIWDEDDPGTAEGLTFAAEWLT